MSLAFPKPLRRSVAGRRQTGAKEDVAVGVRFPEQIRHMEAIVLPRRWEDFGEADGIFRAPRSDKGERMIFDDNFRSSVTARWSRNGRLAITRNAAALQLSLINGQLLLREPMQSKPDKPNTASSGHRKAAKKSAQITEKSPLTRLGFAIVSCWEIQFL